MFPLTLLYLLILFVTILENWEQVSFLLSLDIKGEPELTDPFNLLCRS